MRHTNDAKGIRGPAGILLSREDDAVMKDLVMLIDGETSGRDLDEVLREHGRSRSTYYEKLRRLREQGIAGLISVQPGPRAPWKRSMDVIRLIVAHRLRDPRASAEEIAAALREAGHSISPRSVIRTLSQFGLTRSASLRTRTSTSTPESE